MGVYVVWLNFKELLGMIWILARRSYLGRVFLFWQVERRDYSEVVSLIWVVARRSFLA
jgi:hypothetical protein